MFKEFLRSTENSWINLSWVKKIDGLVRVAILDEEQLRAYVVVYREKSNLYSVIAFDMTTGDFFWVKDLPNGGYGAPAITNSCIVVPTRFRSITALAKDDGSQKWTVDTESRVRSPINFIEGKIYFSSGNTLFEVDVNGTITNEWTYPRAFFYGCIDVFDGLIISLGVVDDEEGNSIVNVFAFSLDGSVIYKLPLYLGPVVSSDTSGVLLRGEFGFVGGDGLVFCFELKSGKTIWISSIDGYAGRQVCTADEKHVYYVTQSGSVGALNAFNGESNWQMKTKDRCLDSPISIIKGNLAFLSDACLNILDSVDGSLLKKIPIGHTPYSMLSLGREFGVLGAGEPPHDGLLFGFKLSNSIEKEKYTCHLEFFNAFIEEDALRILVKLGGFNEKVVSVKLHGKIFGLDGFLLGRRVDSCSFSFFLPIPRTINSGDYVVLLYIHLESGNCVAKPVMLSLDRRVPLPVQAQINSIPCIVQEKPDYSGVAIACAIKKFYGESHIDQSDMREMIDASRDFSGYEPHETWRIIFRRVLSSAAKNKNQLPEFVGEE